MADTSSTFPTQLDTFPNLVSRRATSSPIASEPFTVPASSPYDYVLVEVPESATLVLSGAPPGGAGSYTVQTSPPSQSGEVQVNWKTGRLTFHSTDASGNVSAAYTGLGSALTVERILKTYNAIVATESSLGAQYIPTGFATLKAYLQSELNILRAEAHTPVGPDLKINGGACFINLHTRVTLADTDVDLATGTYQFPASTATYWRRALFVVDTTGTLGVYWSPEVATQGGLVSPVRKVKDFAICFVDCEDDGSGVAGSCNDINPADIIDMRQQLNLGWDVEASAFLVQQKVIATTSVFMFGGTFFYRNASGVVTEVAVVDTTLAFGTGQTYETTAITASHYNALVVTVTSAGVIKTYEGTSAAVKGSVVLPGIPKYDEFPVAVVYFQDDGTGTAGTILDIVQADILNLYMPRLVVAEDSSFIPALTFDDIDDLRVHEQSTPDKTVEIEPGDVLGRMGELSWAYLGSTLDFGTGTHQKTVPGTNWLPVVVTINLNGSTINTYDGTEGATVGTSVAPRCPDHELPLATVMLQGDGTGNPGGINNVVAANISDARHFKSWQWKWYQDGLRCRRSTVANGKVTIEKGHSFWEDGSWYELGADTLYDVAGNLVYALGVNFYKWILLSMKPNGTIEMTEPTGTGGTTPSLAPSPTIEYTGKNRPLCRVLIQDNGSAGVGTIIPIEDIAIFTAYEWATFRFHTEDWFAVAANTTYTVTHGLDRLPRSIQVLWQSTGSGGSDGASDITLVSGPVFLNTGASVIEISTTVVKIRTDSYVVGYRNSAGALQQPTAGYYKVVVS